MCTENTARAQSNTAISGIYSHLSSTILYSIRRQNIHVMKYISWDKLRSHIFRNRVSTSGSVVPQQHKTARCHTVHTVNLHIPSDHIHRDTQYTQLRPYIWNGSTSLQIYVQFYVFWKFESLHWGRCKVFRHFLNIEKTDVQTRRNIGQTGLLDLWQTVRLQL